jgi:hypothetical protein
MSDYLKLLAHLRERLKIAAEAIKAQKAAKEKQETRDE